jgi:hypothetical protein
MLLRSGFVSLCEKLKVRATWRLGRAASHAALVLARDCHVQVTGCKFAEKSKGADLIVFDSVPY